MKFVLGLIKKGFFWSYARNTWQWDVLCVLILIFIFLTPKSWFVGGERRPVPEHQIAGLSTVWLEAEAIDYEKDRAKCEERVRLVSGRPDAQVIGVHSVVDNTGKTVGYKVDIR